MKRLAIAAIALALGTTFVALPKVAHANYMSEQISIQNNGTAFGPPSWICLYGYNQYGGVAMDCKPAGGAGQWVDFPNYWWAAGLFNGNGGVDVLSCNANQCANGIGYWYGFEATRCLNCGDNLWNSGDTYANTGNGYEYETDVNGENSCPSSCDNGWPYYW